MSELDTRLTFDTFVVGPANRLASAAARRVAHYPGRNYNPLFIYSASGLGKTHILLAIAHHAARQNGDGGVLYQALESYLEELAEAIRTGTQDEMRERYRTLEIMLLDDVQFLADQPQAQELLLSTLDALTAAGSQVVLASDRPPAEINGLDLRLVSRFSGGLIVDIAPPEYETRVAIVRRKAEEQGQELQPGVAEAIARQPFPSVRELQGALNRVLAVQELEERTVSAQEVPRLTGYAPDDVPDFGSFVEELAKDLASVVEAKAEVWRTSLRQAAEAAEREGFSAGRLRAYLRAAEPPPGWEEIVSDFKGQLTRLREIEGELDRLGNPWPDVARSVIRDPERMSEAEALLTSVRERQRAFLVLGPGPTLGHLTRYVPRLALRAVTLLVGQEKPRYNPLFLWGPKPAAPRALLGAAGRSYQKVNPEGRVAVTSVADFAEDFIRALSAGVAGAWRERWWTVDLLLVYGTEALASTEQAQDEFFHLFEALKRRGSRILLASDRPPSAMEGIDQRLRSRFEGGLVLEVAAEGLPSGADDLNLQEATGLRGSATDGSRPPAVDAPLAPELAQVASPPALATAAGPARASGRVWRPTAEKVVWTWPRMSERIVEDLK